MTRSYRLGVRQAAIDRTAQSILGATRRLLAGKPITQVSLGAIAREAGVSRLTIYQRFGSRAGLLEALAPRPASIDVETANPREALRVYLLRAAEAWAADAALYRHLPAATAGSVTAERRLAEQLLAADALRPGCSIREAEDVIGALASFAVFDRLHRDGRRSPTAVADVLMRLAGAILA